MESRETLLVIYYNNVKVTNDIQPYIQSFSYHDNSKLEIDDIDLSLENIDGRWFNDWFPNDGDEITVSIVKRRWDDQLVEETLPCGKFYVDQIDFSPGSISIKALAIPASGNLNTQLNSVAWEKIAFKQLALDIANKHSVKLDFYTESNVFYERIDQDKESDLTFLNRICETEGLNLKLTDNKIIIFEKEEFYKEEEVISVSRLDTDMMINYKFSHTTKEIYDSVETSYYDPNEKKLIRKVYTKEELEEERKKDNEAKKKDDKGKESEASKRAAKQENSNTKNKSTLKINSSTNDNSKETQAKLDEQNKEKETASLTVRGNFNLLAGQNIVLTDFGFFDGKYSIEKTTHSLSGAYTTDLELKRISE